MKRVLVLISLILALSGIGLVQASLNVVTTTADFTISANPATLTLLVGFSGSSNITLSSIGSFNAVVKLSSTVSQIGVGATLSTTSVKLTSGGSPNSQLSISTTNSTAPGSYVVTVTGRSGKLSHSAAVRVVVVTKIGNPPTLDGSSNNFCSHNTDSCSTLLTTSNKNDIIIAYTVEVLDLQTSCTFSVSDTAGLAWSLRAQATARNDGTTGTDRDQLAEFWALSANPLVNDSITESILGCASIQYGGEYNGLMTFGISGANTTSPFDANSSVPATSSDNFSANTSVQLSTNNPADMIIGAVLHGTAALPTPGSGFTLITSSGGGANAAEYETVTTAESNATVSFQFSTSSYWEMVADAVQGV